MYWYHQEKTNLLLSLTNYLQSHLMAGRQSEIHHLFLWHNILLVSYKAKPFPLYMNLPHFIFIYMVTFTNFVKEFAIRVSLLLFFCDDDGDKCLSASSFTVLLMTFFIMACPVNKKHDHPV